MSEIGGVEWDVGQKVRLLTEGGWRNCTITGFGTNSRSREPLALLDNHLTFQAEDVERHYVEAIREDAVSAPRYGLV